MIEQGFIRNADANNPSIQKSGPIFGFGTDLVASMSNSVRKTITRRFVNITPSLYIDLKTGRTG